jgi:hypothetical protein
MQTNNFPVAAPQHANQDEWKTSTIAQGLYDKILSKIETEVVSLGAILHGSDVQVAKFTGPSRACAGG